MGLAPIPQVLFDDWQAQEDERKRQEALDAVAAQAPPELHSDSEDAGGAGTPLASSPFILNEAPPEQNANPGGGAAGGASTPSPYVLDEAPPEVAPPGGASTPAASSPYVLNEAPPAGSPAPNPAPTPTSGRGQGLVPDQFGDPQLTNAEAQAACGPAAAIAFARANGRNPTLREAVDLAKQFGWTPGAGQAGPQAQQQLLQAMGVPSKLEAGVDWSKVQQDVQSGNPVTISTPDHYFVATAYDPASGKFNFEKSGTVMGKYGGSDWMTPQQMQSITISGKPHAPGDFATLYMDHPATPNPSPAVSGASGSLQDYARQAAQRAGIDPELFVRQIQQESGFEPYDKNGNVKTSPAGAVGIAQIVPSAHPGVDATNPQASLDYAANLMAGYLRQYGDYPTALAAYNAGPGNVAKFGGVPPFEETQRYVKTILNNQTPAVPTPSTSGTYTPPSYPALQPYQPSPLEQDYLNRVAPLMQAFTQKTGVAAPQAQPLAPYTPPTLLPTPDTSMLTPSYQSADLTGTNFKPTPPPKPEPASAPAPEVPPGLLNYEPASRTAGPPPVTPSDDELQRQQRINELNATPASAYAPAPAPSAPPTEEPNVLQRIAQGAGDFLGALGRAGAGVQPQLSPEQQAAQMPDLWNGYRLKPNQAPSPDFSRLAPPGLPTDLSPGDVLGTVSGVLGAGSPMETQQNVYGEIGATPRRLAEEVPGVKEWDVAHRGPLGITPLDVAEGVTNLLLPMPETIAGGLEAQAARKVVVRSAAQSSYEKAIRETGDIQQATDAAIAAGRQADDALQQELKASSSRLQGVTLNPEQLQEQRGQVPVGLSPTKENYGPTPPVPGELIQERAAQRLPAPPASERVPWAGDSPSSIDSPFLSANSYQKPTPEGVPPVRLTGPAEEPPSAAFTSGPDEDLLKQYQAALAENERRQAQAAKAPQAPEGAKVLGTVEDLRGPASAPTMQDVLDQTINAPTPPPEPGLRDMKLVKSYGVNGGTRFAAVEVNGERFDVPIRGPSDGSRPNAWGDAYPIQETRTTPVKQKALEMWREKYGAEAPETSPQNAAFDVGDKTVNDRGSSVKVEINGERRPDIEQKIVAPGKAPIIEGTAQEVSPAIDEKNIPLGQPRTPDEQAALDQRLRQQMADQGMPVAPPPVQKPLANEPLAPGAILGWSKNPFDETSEYRLQQNPKTGRFFVEKQVSTMRGGQPVESGWKTIPGTAATPEDAVKNLGAQLRKATDDVITPAHESLRDAYQLPGTPVVLRPPENIMPPPLNPAARAQAEQQLVTQAKSLKFTQGSTILPSLDPEKLQPIKGWVNDGLIITKNPETKLWDVRHETSGQTLVKGLANQQEAKVAVARLQELHNWNQPIEDLGRTMPPETQQAVRVLAKDVYAPLPQGLPERAPGPTAEEFLQGIRGAPEDNQPFFAWSPKLPKLEVSTHGPEGLPPHPNPGSPEAVASEKFGNQAISYKPPTSKLSAPQWLDLLATEAAHLFTNDNAHLERIQRHVIDAWHSVAGQGVDLPPWMNAVNLNRILGGAYYPAEQRVQKQLQAAYDHAGPKLIDGLKGLLEARDNLDKARSVGRQAAARVMKETYEPPPAKASDLKRAQMSLNALLRQPSVDPNRLKAAQRKVTSLQNWISRDEQAWQVHQQYRAQTEEQAARMGRKFSGGLDEQETLKGIQGLKDRYTPEEWQRIEESAGMVDQYVKDLRDRLVSSGVITPQLGRLLEEHFPHYIPTNILDYLEDPKNVRLGTSINLTDDGLRKLTEAGTERSREDVTQSLVRLAFETERRAAKNETARAVWDWRGISPEVASLVREVPLGTSHEKWEFPVHFYDHGVKKELLVDKSLAPAFQFPTSQTPTMTFNWRGHEQQIKPFEWPANVTRATATTFNPIFALLRNPILDAPSYFIDSASRYGIDPKTLWDITHTLASSYHDAFQGLMKDRVEGKFSQRFLGHGGGQFGFFGGTEQEARQLARQVESGGGYLIQNPKDLAKFALNAVPTVGERAELAPRVAAMRLAEKRGGGLQEAVMRGRDTTVDFSRGGALTKFIGAYVPFFNVNAQSIPWMARLYQRNPVGATAAMASLVIAPTLALEAWNRSDPERARAYDDIPDYVKRQGLVFMADKPYQGVDENGQAKYRYGVLPLRQLATIVNPVREAAARGFGTNNPHTWQQVGADMVSSASPVPVDDAQQAAGALLPAIFGTALQLATNKDLYRGTDIATNRGNDRATALSKFLSERTGGAIQPSQAEFAIRDSLNGVGNIFLASADLASRIKDEAIGGKAPPKTTYNDQPNELPFVGGMTAGFLGSRGGAQDKLLRDLRDQTASQYRQQFQDAFKQGQGAMLGISPDERSSIDDKLARLAGDLATSAVYGSKEDPHTKMARIEKDPGFLMLPISERARLLAEIRQAYGLDPTAQQSTMNRSRDSRVQQAGFEAQNVRASLGGR